MHRVRAPVRQLTTQAYDGIPLRVHVVGKGPLRWLLPPGLGTPALAWRPLYERLARDFTIATWDLRGCYASGRPRAAGMRVEDHAADGEAVLRALGWDDGPVVLGGWSLGVQISLELHRRLRERVAGLVLVCGAYEHLLATALPLPQADKVLSPLLAGLSRAGVVLNPLGQRFLSHRRAAELMCRLRVVRGEEGPHLRDVLAEFGRLDLATLMELTVHAHAHSARDVLPTIAQPTLIVAGERDTLTPLHVSRKMHAKIPGSELFVVPEGTHYAVLEHPELVVRRIERFLAERVFPEVLQGRA